ncbi:MAG: immunoglobulin domain-containing protein [Verrucomicrobia bacterium]|nr:immunoglobulin domain-containing protein [Verrucomicrobiota bacterium]
MADPKIVLYNSLGVAMASNDDWGTPATANDVSASVLSSAATQIGASSLNAGSKDSAMIATLAPGAYSVQLSGANSTTGVALAEIYDVTSLNLNLPAPAITTQPSSVTVNAGASVTFNVAVSGTAVAYQWYKNGVAISGATTASFTINAAASANAGNYTVTVTNAAGVVTSNAATLTVN